MKLICLFRGHVQVPFRHGGRVHVRCSRCGGIDKMAIVRSAETSRLTGLRKIPVSRRRAYIDELRRNAK